MQDINRANLRDYPTKDELIEAWRAGIQMAKVDENPRPDLQFNIMDDDDDDDDDGDDHGDDDDDYNNGDHGNDNSGDKDFTGKWLKRPFSIFPFDYKCEKMVSETDLEDARENFDIEICDGEVIITCTEMDQDPESRKCC